MDVHEMSTSVQQGKWLYDRRQSTVDRLRQ